ncbi:MAG: hypothetical protein ACC618_01755 [Patescibacteria group bacterium]
MSRGIERKSIGSKAFRIGGVASIVFAQALAAGEKSEPILAPTFEPTESPATLTFTPKLSPTPPLSPALSEPVSDPQESLTRGKATPSRRPTHTPTPTETLVPTPDILTIDGNNQTALEQARGGELVDLPNANVTSVWKLPWFAEKGEPKDAFIAFTWGEKTSSGLVTSAECLFEHYRKSGNLGEQVWPLPEIWRPEERLNNLRVKVSDVPSPIKIVNAELLIINPEDPPLSCEEIKELGRLQSFLGNIDWEELPNDIGEVSGQALGKFIFSFLNALNEARKRGSTD